MSKLGKTTRPKKLTSRRPWRFTVVGVINTVIDFLILNILSTFGVAKILANTISTGLAMISSFWMNKKWTFNSASKNYVREVCLFIVVTLFGLWVIQNGVMWLILRFVPTFGIPDWLFLNIAKVAASLPSLIWNFLTYDRLVFKSKSLD